MRIGCFDKSAAARLELQQFIEHAFSCARDVVGHIRGLEIVPATLTELCLPTQFDAAVFGPALPPDERFLACRKLSESNHTLPMFLLFAEEEYSFRTLRRFERCTPELFSVEESPLRLVHRLCLAREKREEESRGLVVACAGVKGGVGTSSLTLALAHAADSVGKRAVVLDVAAANPLPHYLFAPRSASPDFAAALLNHLPVDRSFVEKCLVTAPNGLTLLLQPAGGTETRFLWLYDVDRVELTLSVVDLLTKMFDLVLLDLGTGEGPLVSALFSQAHRQVLVAAAEPAAAHLLGRTVSSLAHVAEASKMSIVVNGVAQDNLPLNDIKQLVASAGLAATEEIAILHVPYDRRAAQWIGTGNTFYTEGSQQTQQRLDNLLQQIIDRSSASSLVEEEGRHIFSIAKGLVTRPLLQLKSAVAAAANSTPALALPAPVEPVRALPALTPAPVAAGDIRTEEIHPLWFGQPELVPSPETVSINGKS